MDKSSLTAYIKSLEETLLSVNVRKNPMELEKLIDDEFIEISKSGKIWNKQSLIEHLQIESIKNITISDFSLKFLSNNIVLATYTANQIYSDDTAYAKSLRSSIWILSGTSWKMIFHQGTGISD